MKDEENRQKHEHETNILSFIVQQSQCNNKCNKNLKAVKLKQYI